MVEALLNITLSLALAPRLGIVGVAIGTVVAMTYRTVFQVWYLRKHIMNRPFIKFVKVFFTFVIPTACVCAACMILMPIEKMTIINWVSHAVVYSLILLAALIIVSIAFFRKEVADLKSYIKRK